MNYAIVRSTIIEIRYTDVLKYLKLAHRYFYIDVSIYALNSSYKIIKVGCINNLNNLSTNHGIRVFSVLDWDSHLEIFNKVSGFST